MDRISLAPFAAPLAALWTATVAAQAPLETVVVIGTEQSLRADRAEIARMPGGATLIDMESFRERSVGSLADTLTYVPGLWAASHNGSDGLFFSSRGSNLDATDYDMNGIKLMHDGLPVTSADGSNHNRIIDPFAARYATVARGANAFAYGASTLGGAIDFATPTAHDAPGADLSITAGSHGQAMGRLTLARVFAESADGLVTVETKRWDGYRDHNEQERTGFYANAGWQASDRIASRFYVTYIENDQELPGSLTRAELEANPDQASGPALGGNYQLNVDTWRLANKTTWQIAANKRIDAGISIEEQALFHPIVDRILVDFDGPGPAPPVEVFSLLIDTDHRDLGTTVRYGQQVADHELSFGLVYGNNEVEGGEYRNLNGTPNGLTAIVANEAATAELFAMDRWQIGPSTQLSLGLQAAAADRRVQSTDASSGIVTNPHARYDRVTARVGALHALGGGTSLYGNVSSLFEPPTNFELEDNVAGGDATLAPMTGSVAEIGARGERSLDAGGNWSWDVSYYYAQIDDEILSVEDPNAPGTSLVTNVDRTIHAGLEGRLSAAFVFGGGTLEPTLAVTVNDFAFDRDVTYDSNDLPAAPKHFAHAEILYRGARGFHFGPTLELVGQRYADFANTYRVDSHSLVGLRAGWANAKWRAFADLRNLGDTSYVATHGVRNIASASDAILNPGEPLSAYFGFQVQLR